MEIPNRADVEAEWRPRFEKQLRQYYQRLLDADFPIQAADEEDEKLFALLFGLLALTFLLSVRRHGGPVSLMQGGARQFAANRGREVMRLMRRTTDGKLPDPRLAQWAAEVERTGQIPPDLSSAVRSAKAALDAAQDADGPVPAMSAAEKERNGELAALLAVVTAVLAGTKPPEALSDALRKTWRKGMRKAKDQTFGPARAEKVVVTSTTEGVTAGGEMTAQTLGFRSIEDVWINRPYLSKTGPCPTCSPLHNKPRSVWGRQYPQGPPIHALCVCTIEYAALPADGDTLDDLVTDPLLRSELGSLVS